MKDIKQNVSLIMKIVSEKMLISETEIKHGKTHKTKRAKYISIYLLKKIMPWLTADVISLFFGTNIYIVYRALKVVEKKKESWTIISELEKEIFEKII